MEMQNQILKEEFFLAACATEEVKYLRVIGIWSGEECAEHIRCLLPFSDKHSLSVPS